MKLEPSKIANNNLSNITDEVPLGCHLKISVAANQGGRKYMEDRVHIETVRDSDGTIKFTFLGVFDGHGGYEASDFVRQHLLRNIISNELFESEDDSDILEAIKEGFLLTHEEMTKYVDTWPRTASGFPSTAGTTCSVALIRNGKIYTGHVGDSAIFIGSRANKASTRLLAERLTVDHKPESLEEQARIELAGGKVAMKSGIFRVVWTRPVRGHIGPVRRNTPMEYIPFLAVARSLGDLWSFCEDTKQYVVSPEPDLAVRELTEDDSCLILVSDGITNVLAPMQLTRAIEEVEAAKPEILLFDKEEGRIRDRQPNHARKILFDALKRWNTLRADNLSAVVVLFDPPYVDADDYEHCVDEVLKDNESIDEALSLDPESMIHVTPGCTQKLLTYRTPLVYEGTLDGNFSSVDYRGPGFMTHDEEDEIEARILLKKKAQKELDEAANAAIGANVTLDEEPELPTIELPEEDKTEERKPVKREHSPSKENVDCLPKKLHSEEAEMEGVSEGDHSDEEEPAPETPACTSEPSSSSPPDVTCTPTTSATSPSRSIKTRSAAKVLHSQSMETPKGRKIAVAARRLSLAKDGAMDGIVTRSRDRKPAVPFAVDASALAALATPLRSVEGTRKRPSRIAPLLSAGVTPQLERFSLNTPGSARSAAGYHASVPQVRSEPSTPTKTCATPPLNSSSWSLGKTLPSDDDSTTEPPSKIRRIYGFVRRLVGLGTPA